MVDVLDGQNRLKNYPQKLLDQILISSDLGCRILSKKKKPKNSCSYINYVNLDGIFRSYLRTLYMH